MKAPGTRIVGWLAALVPAYRRAEWLAEWRSELLHSFEESQAMNTARAWSALRLRVRAAGAVCDALWLRRAYGRGGRMRETWREATRVLRRQPGFTLMVVGTLALGIGGATAIFSAVDGLMLRPLPFRDPDRLVSIEVPRSAGTSPLLDVEEARVWRDRDDVFAAVRMYTWGRSFVLTRRGEPQRLGSQLLEPGFLSMLGLAPALGREFAEEEAVSGRDRVVMLSHETWRTAFGSDPSVVGEAIFLNEEPHLVVGIAPRELRRLPTGFPDIYLPLTDPPPARDMVAMLARVRPDVPRAVAQSRLDALGAHLEEKRPRQEGWAVRLDPLGHTLAIETRRGLQALAGAVTFLLLVACINAAGLLFVRGVARRTEMAIRGALGGTRGQLFRESLAESLLLALLAGLGGTLLAWWGVRALVAIAPEAVLRFSYNSIELDARVLTFALLLTVLTGLAFGITPALRAARAGSFTGGRRTATAERGETRLRSVVQALQVALAVVLLASAGLLGRSFVELMRVDPGFDPADLLVVSYSLLSERYPEGAQRTAFHRALDERLRILPGIEAVSWNRTGVPPNIGILGPVAPEAEGGTSIAVASGILPWAVVDSAYFSVLRTPIVQGRTFNATDLLPDANSVIIDVDLADALWPDGQAVGRRFRAGPDREWVTVVGVSGDVKLGDLDDRLGPFALFEPTSIDKLRDPQIAIRTTGDAAALPALIRETIHELDPLLPIESITSADELLRDSIQERRFVLTTMTAFAVVALILAAIGVYGLVAFTVARRTREIGIRKAIGAHDGQIVGAVFARGLAIAGGGLVIGLLATAVVSHLLTALLFGVPRHDPITLVMVTLVLLLACAAALIVPARRAARVDAAWALRVE